QRAEAAPMRFLLKEALPVCESLEEGWFDDTTDDIEEVTLQKITNYSITKKEKTETDWLNETDCDRRTRAFEELSSIDIITAVAASISSFS
ncbi:MAG: hypothetical protein K2Z81_02530, partial [Cyanobacteria bacterium]|nr:hypothetical protein [Cyanobacteriota bacterium]